MFISSHILYISPAHGCVSSFATNMCTEFSISTQLHAGSFFTPVAFIIFLTLAASSHCPVEAYMLYNSTGGPVSSGSSSKT
uniref:Uncharacterized protein n=1 Tax=Arundo donax TaxID=35708 RepID=A0A0A9GAZ8_ARUDO